MSEKKKAAVVGAGIGGLAAAVTLATAGFKVSLYEKNPGPGGKLNLLEKDGFKFDLGPSILTLPQIFRTCSRAPAKSWRTTRPYRK